MAHLILKSMVLIIGFGFHMEISLETPVIKNPSY